MLAISPQAVGKRLDGSAQATTCVTAYCSGATIVGCLNWEASTFLEIIPNEKLVLEHGSDKGDDPQWLYTVVFPARELWGEAADPTVSLSIEAFEPYLEPA